jgi:hypothetical protein
MNTKTIASQGYRQVAVYALGAALVVSSFFALSVPRAHASQLTEPQIQAILNLLKAFEVPAATITNVSNILHKKN